MPECPRCSHTITYNLGTCALKDGVYQRRRCAKCGFSFKILIRKYEQETYIIKESDKN